VVRNPSLIRFVRFAVATTSTNPTICSSTSCRSWNLEVYLARHVV
jgi:hypothetical protein